MVRVFLFVATIFAAIVGMQTAALAQGVRGELETDAPGKVITSKRSLVEDQAAPVRQTRARTDDVVQMGAFSYERLEGLEMSPEMRELHVQRIRSLQRTIDVILAMLERGTFE